MGLFLSFIQTLEKTKTILYLINNLFIFIYMRTTRLKYCFGQYLKKSSQIEALTQSEPWLKLSNIFRAN